MSNSIYTSGSAFNGKKISGHHPIAHLTLTQWEYTSYVSLTAWCNNNFISKKTGYNLIKKKLLIAQKMYGQWWVCANLQCLDELLDYLQLDELYFDGKNKF